MFDDRIRPLLKFNRNVRFVDEIFRITEGTGSEGEAVRILREAEAKNGLEITTIMPFPPPEKLPDTLYDEHMTVRFFRFLSDTNLVLSSAETYRLSVLFAEGYVYAWGLREWGHIVANWANKSKWLGYVNWRFEDFTAGPSDATIKSYNLWAETVDRILELKCSVRTEEAQKSIPELVRQLRQNKDKSVRKAALETLSGIRSNEAMSAIAAAAESESDAEVLGDIRYYLSLPDWPRG